MILFDFKDHFSNNSAQYGQYRPMYPKELFKYLALISPSNAKAWDCACGTGQSALGLSKYFTQVIATDASQNQIRKAVKKSTITYQISSAENSYIPNEEIDLVTVAQALHWFNIDSFFIEAHRVLKRNGILAVWTYNLLDINETLNLIIDELYSKILSQYWPIEREMVENGYCKINFPFSTVSTPIFRMQAKWNLVQLIGYLETWSAIKKYREENNHDAITKVFSKIKSFWGNPEEQKVITWPLTLKVQQKIQ
jgi:ubiquinone/menaquinone biosynthesis C-methylase UbiE